jgi:hypothetical protein
MVDDFDRQSSRHMVTSNRDLMGKFRGSYGYKYGLRLARQTGLQTSSTATHHEGLLRYFSKHPARHRAWPRLPDRARQPHPSGLRGRHAQRSPAIVCREVDTEH